MSAQLFHVLGSVENMGNSAEKAQKRADVVGGHFSSFLRLEFQAQFALQHAQTQGKGEEYDSLYELGSLGWGEKGIGAGEGQHQRE